MSKLHPVQPIKPDVEIVIKYDSKTGQINIETGNGKPLNPYLVLTICSDVIKANATQLLEVHLQQMNALHLKPHEFFALDGENRCRVPRCGKIKSDLIHVLPATEKSVVQ